MKVSAAIVLLALTGCATINDGTTQQITLKNVPETGCSVGDFTVSPHWQKPYTVSKGNGDLVFKCGDKTLVAKSTVSKWGVTSITLVDFGLVDSMTGALWQYPEEIDLNEAK